MAYATHDDVRAIYDGTTIDRLTWDKTTSTALVARLDTALDNASTEIDAFISTRYPVPVTPTPPILKQINIDLGVYYLALTADKMSEIIAKRADDWRKYLALLAKGQVGLGVRTDQPGADDSSVPEGTGSMTGSFSRAIRV